MYNNPYDHFRQQNMNNLNQNQMDSMQDMGYQQPYYNQMPTMPMEPIQPKVPMGTVTGATDNIPVYGTTSGSMPTNIGSIPISSMQLAEPPIMDTEYTQGYLKTQIGKKIKADFLIGTNIIQDREGTLLDVGISYIIIREVETDDKLLCDIYSIKFVRFYG